VVEWCRARSQWTTGISGYPGVVECAPTQGSTPEAEAAAVIGWAARRLGAPSWAPERASTELIGGRFRVYRFWRGPASRPEAEARVVVDERLGRAIWAGQALPFDVPEVLEDNAPGWEPALSEPETVDPGPAPAGQKTIRRPVRYAAEGVPEPRDDVIRLGYYTREGPVDVASVAASALDGHAGASGFHCVTGWSVGGLQWRGARLLDLLRDHGLGGRWLVAVSWGGYAAPIPLSGEWIDSAIVAVSSGAGPLGLEEGWPARLVVPALYGWKHVKWLRGLYVGDDYLDGFWEARGYHWRGLVALEERFKDLATLGNR